MTRLFMYNSCNFLCGFSRYVYCFVRYISLICFAWTFLQTSCSGIRCMNMDRNSANYTITYSYPTPTDGSYCGSQMVSLEYVKILRLDVLAWVETGFQHEQRYEIKDKKCYNLQGAGRPVLEMCRV